LEAADEIERLRALTTFTTWGPDGKGVFKVKAPVDPNKLCGRIAVDIKE